MGQQRKPKQRARTVRERAAQAAQQTPPSYCAPARYTHYQARGSCLLADEVREIAESYNRAVDGQFRINTSTPTPSILSALRARLGPEEHTWIDSPLLARVGSGMEELNDAFRPKMPREWTKNEYQWLSTDEIEDVMRQYEEKHRDFRFIGVFPIDFDARMFMGRCVADEMCRLQVTDLRRDNVRQFGAVLNLDKHNQRGSHWVALYGNIDADARNYGLHYYDSVGRRPSVEVRSFTSRIASQMAALNKTNNMAKNGATGRRVGQTLVDGVPVSFNTIRRQFKNSECGIFAMYFLVCCMSERVPIPEIWRAMGRDETIHTLRNIFFRPP